MIHATNGKQSYNESARSTSGVEWPLRQLAVSVIDLASLQFRLFTLDAAAWGRAVNQSLKLFFAGAVICLAALPGLGISAALGLVALGWPPAIAMLCVAASALILGAGLAYYAGRRIQHSWVAFHRSHHEFQENMRWLRDELQPSEEPNSFDQTQ